MKRHNVETREVVISNEDVRNIEEFFSVFKIEQTPGLTNVLEKIKKAGIDNIAFEDQAELRAQLSHAISVSQQPLVLDPAFSSIRESATSIADEMLFDKEIEVILKESSATEQAEQQG